MFKYLLLSFVLGVVAGWLSKTFVVAKAKDAASAFEDKMKGIA